MEGTLFDLLSTQQPPTVGAIVTIGVSDHQETSTLTFNDTQTPSANLEFNARNGVNGEPEEVMDWSCDEVFCPKYHFNTWMYATIVFYGSACALFSLTENIIIVVRLARLENCFRSQYVVLLLLAIFDSITSALYIPVIVIDQYTDRHTIDWLDRVWHAHFGLGLALCNLSLTASCLLITLLQFERFLMVVHGKSSLHKAVRLVMCAAAVFIALVLKAPMYWEYEVAEEYDEFCNETTFIIGRAPMTDHFLYSPYQFYIRNMLSVIVPFFLLAYFNVAILCHFRRIARWTMVFHMVGTQHKQFTRSATSTFVLIASTYLVSNVINVVITAWEFFDLSSLFEEYCYFYQISTDIVSLLTLTCCALRLPIYLITNDNLRRVVLGRPLNTDNTLQCISTVRKGGVSMISTNGIDRIAIAIAVQLHADSNDRYSHKLSVATGPARTPSSHSRLSRKSTRALMHVHRTLSAPKNFGLNNGHGSEQATPKVENDEPDGYNSPMLRHEELCMRLLNSRTSAYRVNRLATSDMTASATHETEIAEASETLLPST